MKALKKINELISDANPDGHPSVSYNKYFGDLTSISDILLEDEEEKKLLNKQLLLEVLNLPDSESKTKIINHLTYMLYKQ